MDKNAGSLWVIDTVEKRLLVAILEQTFLDLYSYAKHGIIETSQSIRRHKAKKRFRKTKEEVDLLIEYVHSDSRAEWSMHWILETISTDFDAALSLCNKARDEILARKFGCADFRQKILNLYGIKCFDLI